MKTGLFDKNNIELEIGDQYTSSGSNTVYTVFFKGGAVCGGISEKTAVPLGWDFEDDIEEINTSNIIDYIVEVGPKLNWLEVITTN